MSAAIVLTTRGNYAKFKKLIPLLDFGVELVVGGELLLKDRATDLFIINGNNINRQVARLYFDVRGDTTEAMAKSIGVAVSEFSTVFNHIKPSVVFLVGDRYETMGAATAAYTNRIPIAHLEGGEVSGSLDDGFRRAITELSTYHFPATEKAGHNIQKDHVYAVGSTSIDIIADTTKTPGELNHLQMTTGSGAFVDTTLPYLLVVYHPDTNYAEDLNIDYMISAIDEIGMPTIVLNSNLDSGSDLVSSKFRVYNNTFKPDNIHFFKSLPIEYYGALLKNAACIVGDSSSGIREACFTGTPNVSVGDRQINREHGENTVYAKNGEILDAIIKQVNHGRYPQNNLYGDGTACKKIAEVMNCILA